MGFRHYVAGKTGGGQGGGMQSTQVCTYCKKT